VIFAAIPLRQRATSSHEQQEIDLVNVSRQLFGEAIGIRRIFALIVLLTGIAAVAYLERSVAGALDLRLIYFMIVLTAAMVLPRLLALACAAGVAIVEVGVSGDSGASFVVNGLTHLLMYGYAALLTSNWEQERRRLMRMSRIDDLTGLHNLRALREQLPVWLGPAVRTRRSMAVMVLDLDGFKQVNDKLGHGAGNELLKEVAHLLRFAVRVGDEPFRFGGDEFVVLLSDADADGAMVVATRVSDIYRTMGQTLRGTEVEISFSIGIAVFPDDGETAEALLAKADEALYQAKRAGRGRIAKYQAQAAA
jgi:diguanylate cyclase (GGDEF)-like protein